MQSSNKAPPTNDELESSSTELTDSGVRFISHADRAALVAAEAAKAKAESAKVCPKILAAHLPLVHKIIGPIARRVPANVQHDDLLVAGISGLADSLRKNGGDSGATFKSYARTRIRGAILDELRAQDSLSRRARDAVNASQVSEIDKPDDVTVVGLDELLRDEEEEFCRSGSKNPEELYAHKEVLELLRNDVELLSQREQFVIKMYYGDERTFRDIGIMLGISETRAFQIHTRALDQLRCQLLGRPRKPQQQHVCQKVPMFAPGQDDWDDDSSANDPLDVA